MKDRYSSARGNCSVGSVVIPAILISRFDRAKVHYGVSTAIEDLNGEAVYLSSLSVSWAACSLSVACEMGRNGARSEMRLNAVFYGRTDRWRYSGLRRTSDG